MGEHRGATSRSRWAAIGAALAVAIGGGGLLTASAADTPSSPGTYVGITPCRVVDTRPAPDNVGPRATPIGSGETYSTPFVGAVGKCNIPANAVAVVLNLAIVNPTGNSFLTVFPAGGGVPLAANLNYVAGQAPTSNAATVRIGTAGQLSFFNLRGTVDVTADVSGYYLPAGGSAPVTISVNPQSMQLPVAKSELNGCVTNSATMSGSQRGIIPLSLPVGATVTGFAASAFGDGFTWDARLVHARVGTGGVPSSKTQVFTTLGSFLSNAADFASASGTGVVVQSSDVWSIELRFTGAIGWGLCSAEVSYVAP